MKIRYNNLSKSNTLIDKHLLSNIWYDCTLIDGVLLINNTGIVLDYSIIKWCIANDLKRWEIKTDDDHND